MKISLYLISLLLTVSAYGQNYYADVSQVTGESESFTVTHLSTGSYNIANSKNTKESQPITFLDGTPVGDFKVSANPEDTKQLQRAIEETVSAEEILNLKSDIHGMFIGFVVNPQTARTDEVSFNIPNTPVYTAISPEKFEILERKIKQYVRWMISPRAKRVSHVIMSTGCLSKYS